MTKLIEMIPQAGRHFVPLGNKKIRLNKIIGLLVIGYSDGFTSSEAVRACIVKIKALSGLAPTDFIRLIRIKKAAELIQEGRYRIGEICYLVGINSSSYFIKLFQKQFGMTPKEFEKHEHV